MVFLNQLGTRRNQATNPYFMRIAFSTRVRSSSITTFAVPEIISDVWLIRPRTSHGRNSTRELLERRFTFHESCPVVNPHVPSPKSAIHTGKAFATPARVKVVNNTYFSSVIMFSPYSQKDYSWRLRSSFEGTLLGFEIESQAVFWNSFCNCSIRVSGGEER